MIDEWRGQDASYRVRCNRCGAEQELRSFTLKRCRFSCPECESRKNELHNAIDAFGKEIRAALEAYDKSMLEAARFAVEHAPTIATCKHCGKTWVYCPPIKRYGRRMQPAYCSGRCNRKHNKQPSNIRSRLRKFGSDGKPRESISLPRLYERDGGICKICGEPTDYGDCTRDVLGRFMYANGRYPTIDHIVPLSKGGTHTWDNVQLAHKDCNCAKKDKVLHDSGAA